MLVGVCVDMSIGIGSIDHSECIELMIAMDLTMAIGMAHGNGPTIMVPTKLYITTRGFGERRRHNLVPPSIKCAWIDANIELKCVFYIL